MNKTKLAETGIVVIILVLIYQLVTTLISAITGIYLIITTPFPRMGSSIYLQLFFPVILYLSAVYLLYFYKKSLAKWLAGNDDDAIVLNVSPASILFVALFCICTMSLLSDLPTLLSNSLGQKSSSDLSAGFDFPENQNSGFLQMMSASKLELFIRLLLAVILLAIASVKLFSGLRIKNNNAA